MHKSDDTDNDEEKSNKDADDVELAALQSSTKPSLSMKGVRDEQTRELV